MVVRLLPALALVALGGPVALTGPVAHAQGATLYVAPAGSDTGNTCHTQATPCATISNAVANAASGDTIKAASGSYTDQISIPAGANLTIVGGNPFVSAETVIHLKTLPAGTTGSVLTVAPGATVLVQGISFSGGTGTTVGADVFGGDVYNQGNLTLMDTTTENGTASAAAGNGFGGGIYSGNIGGAPAQLLVQWSFVGTSIGATGGNTATGSVSGTGGGIYNDTNSVLSVVCSQVSGNSATGTGTGNGIGGGIFNAGTDTTTVVTPVTTTYSFTGDTIFNTTVISNTASGPGTGNAGGAIENTGALTILDSPIALNTATGAAGGGNAVGGGIDSSGTPLVINNSTIAQNSATGTGAVGAVGTAAGGGLNLTAAATLNNVTIGDNTATGSTATGAGIAGAGNGTLANTLLARNKATVPGTPATTTGADCDTAVGTDSGGNIDDDGTCGFTTGAGSVSNSSTIGLGPIDPNTGTMPLAYPTSSAIGIGIASVCEALLGPDGVTLDTDQRGLPRHAVTRGACDSGAYDTGGSITLPNTVHGSLLIPGGRLGFAASTSPSSISFIALQQGASILYVRYPASVTISCPNQCLGTNDVPLAGPVTETITGTGTGKGIFAGTHTVVITLTISRPLVNSPFGPSLGNPTVTAVSVSVDGTTISTANGPFRNNNRIIYTALNQLIP